MYLDDVVIGGRDLEERNCNLQTFLDRASNANLTFSKEKCVFRGTSLRFLGHLIQDGTISPDPNRSAPFVKFPLPVTIKQLEHFIGLAVYHAKWVPFFSKTMEPLFSALKSKSMPLSQGAIDAIHKVKQSVRDAILHIIDPNKPLCLSTNASGTAILSRHRSRLEGQPVAFMSRRFTWVQQRWSPAEVEGFAVVSACQQFRHYLIGKPFTIYCDQHGFVQALNSSSTKRIKMPNSHGGVSNLPTSSSPYDTLRHPQHSSRHSHAARPLFRWTTLSNLLGCGILSMATLPSSACSPC